MPGTGPKRSCVACGSTKDKGELLRFVLTPERDIVPDILSKLPGRGAYTCIAVSCLKGAISNNRFTRSFKGIVRTEGAEEVVTGLKERLRERIGSYLSLANKAGKVVSGSDLVMDLVKRKRAGIIFVAGDISCSIRDRLVDLAQRNGVPHFTVFDKERLGALIGKGLRSTVAIEKSGFAEKVITEVEKYRNFLEGGTDAR